MPVGHITTATSSNLQTPLSLEANRAMVMYQGIIFVTKRGKAAAKTYVILLKSAYLLDDIEQAGDDDYTVGENMIG